MYIRFLLLALPRRQQYRHQLQVLYHSSSSSRLLANALTPPSTRTDGATTMTQTASCSMTTATAPAVAVESTSMAASFSEKKPTYAWCCTASLLMGDGGNQNSNVKVESIAGRSDTDNNNAFQKSVDSKQFDLTVCSDWMEFIERTEGRTGDEGGAGAYDTMRCDLVLSSQEKGARSSVVVQEADQNNSDTDYSKWRIWGEDHHLDRLKNSFLFIAGGADMADQQVTLQEESTVVARKGSHEVIRAMLAEAEASSTLAQPRATSLQNDGTDAVIQLVRLTVLWSLSKDNKHKIVVRGHACSTAKPQHIHGRVAPISVSVAAMAASPHHTHQDQQHHHHEATIDQSLPSRYRDPQIKVASWTRLRKQWERPDTYKPPGVAEVILVRETNDGRHDINLLEGLSSNFFAIYRDGTIRTAHDGVLHGYARHLVLEYAVSCGLTLDPSPILLRHAEEGLWQEAFITSSSRLIYPISRMLMHTADGDSTDDNEFAEIWHDPVLINTNIKRDDTTTNTDTTMQQPKWQQLLDKLLQHGGYLP